MTHAVAGCCLAGIEYFRIIYPQENGVEVECSHTRTKLTLKSTTIYGP